jgi:hypothetical protein
MTITKPNVYPRFSSKNRLAHLPDEHEISPSPAAMRPSINLRQWLTTAGPWHPAPVLFPVLANMFVDGHRPGRQAVFINFYLLAARFSSLSTSWSHSALRFCLRQFFHNRSGLNLSVKSSDFLWFTCGDALKFRQWQQR